MHSPNSWHGTYLIQALNKPRENKGPFKVNPFSFGGGGSGLKNEDAAMLESIWSPEYMGAAEYEFGAFAQTLNAVYAYRRANLLIATVVDINGRIADKSPNSSWYSKGQQRARTSVFVICCKNHFDNIVKVLDSLINETKIPQPYGGDAAVHLKCGIRIWDALYSPTHYWAEDSYHAFGGGLELDNGWFVFTDVDMFRKTCALYGLEVPEDQIARAKRFVPPKALLDNTSVDRKILRAFTEPGISHDFISLCAIVYDIDGKVGAVLPEDQMPLAEQVEKRIRSLIRGKQLVRNPKTKRLSLAPKEAPCPSPS
jgi:hypothetical protein